MYLSLYIYIYREREKATEGWQLRQRRRQGQGRTRRWRQEGRLIQTLIGPETGKRKQVTRKAGGKLMES